MNAKQIWGIIRHAATALGTLLVSIGLLAPEWFGFVTLILPILDGVIESIAVIIGALAAIIATWKSFKSPEKLENGEGDQG